MDSNNFLKIFDKYHKFIYQYIYFRVNCAKEVAEDLTQETFLKAWENRSKFDSKKSHIKTWLATIARNLVIDGYRKTKNIDISDLENTNLISIKDNTDNDIAIHEVRNHINQMNDKEKEGLMLRYFEELNVNEIAQIWDEKPATTRTFLFRTLNKLKKSINGDK